MIESEGRFDIQKFKAFIQRYQINLANIGQSLTDLECELLPEMLRRLLLQGVLFHPNMLATAEGLSVEDKESAMRVLKNSTKNLQSLERFSPKIIKIASEAKTAALAQAAAPGAQVAAPGAKVAVPAETAVQKAIQQEKRKLRKIVKERLNKLDTTAIVQKSQLLLSALDNSELFQQKWQNACIIFLYFPLSSEPQIRPLIEKALTECKTVALPRIEGEGEESRIVFRIVKNLDEDLEIGPYNILQPKMSCETFLEEPDLVLVPGLAFTIDGKRLGRGKRYYDRFLKTVPRAFKVSVAFTEQIVEDLPMTEDDQPVDLVITSSPQNLSTSESSVKGIMPGATILPAGPVDIPPKRPDLP